VSILTALLGRPRGVGLRPAATDDSDFCFALHRAAMGGYVAAVWGWDDAVQAGFHKRVFDPARTRIITVDGRDAGVLIVEERPDEFYLGRIELHPDFQGRGVGGGLIRLLLAEAEAGGRPVTLDVLAVNERAHALYRRLGFRELGRHGDGNVKIRMRAGEGPRARPPGG
jgi:ribosomal protein S18 acetylase RimI-like enzyme